MARYRTKASDPAHIGLEGLAGRPVAAGSMPAQPGTAGGVMGCGPNGFLGARAVRGFMVGLWSTGGSGTWGWPLT